MHKDALRIFLLGGTIIKEIDIKIKAFSYRVYKTQDCSFSIYLVTNYAFTLHLGHYNPGQNITHHNDCKHWSNKGPNGICSFSRR